MGKLKVKYKFGGRKSDWEIVDDVSMKGYSDNSPYRNRKSIDIHSPNGLIDMSETGMPILANGKFLPPYSGMHQFKPGVVREERIMQDGGNVNPIEGDLYSKVLMNRNKDKDFVQRAYAVGQYPNSPMFNQWDDFDTKATHKMGWGEDDSGQAFMFPTIMNKNNEAIKVPNQYANYISEKGYKKATGMPIMQTGGRAPIQTENEWEILEEAQDGKKISLEDFKPRNPNSNERIQQEIINKDTLNRVTKGTKENPVNLQEITISTPRNRNPVTAQAAATRWKEENPELQGSSADLASAMFLAPVGEFSHTPSRVLNYGVGAYKNQDLRFNPYKSELSETLGLETNPDDAFHSVRNFFVDNAADFVVPMEGFSNVGSKTIPKIGEAAKTGLREGVDLVHPVGRRLKQIEQEGVSQGLSTQAIKNRQMQEVGITSLQREGYFPGVSEVLSEYFVPYSYDNAKKRLLDIPKKIIKGDTNTKRLADLDKVILDQGENTLAKPRYDAWRMYSGLPQKHGTFRMAETSPINHPSYTQNELSNLEKFSLNDERRLLTTLPNEYDNLRFMYNDEDLLNNVNYLKDELKNINTLQQKGIDFPRSDFTTTNVMGGHNRRFFDNKMEYNDVWDLDFNGIKVDNYYGKPFMSHGQLDYSLEAPKKAINTLLNRANYLERNINPVKGKTKYDFGNIKLKNYINLQDVKTTKKKLGGKVNTDWEIIQD